jgi:hypothetical protein
VGCRDNGNESFTFIKDWEYIDQVSEYEFLKKGCTAWRSLVKMIYIELIKLIA